MQTERLSKNSPGSGDKSPQLHKDILRLAIAYRAEDRRIDELLKKLSKLPAGDKPQQIELLLSDIIDAVIAYKEHQSAQDPFARFALKFDQLNPSHDLLSPHIENILGGDRSTLMAETFAKDISQTLQSPNPELITLSEFCASLPISEQIKRDVHSLKNAVLAGTEQLENVASLEALVSEMYAEFSGKTSLHNADQSVENSMTVDACRAQLLELMNLVEFPKRLCAQADTIRKKISHDKEQLDLENSLGAVSFLIQDMRKSLETEISRLTDFLESLTSRLDTLDDLIDSSSSFHDTSIENRNKLQHDIDQQVDSMRENIESGSGIDKIRTLISSRINKLSSHLSSYVALETQRQDEAKTQLNEMSQAVHILETQTEKLHHDLKQQQLQLQIDPLTKVLNRSGYDKILRDALQKQQHSNVPFSLAVIDIDYFKKINDEFGHIAGDKVLINLANQVKAHIRQTDTLCRYGGEEFAILLAETDGQTAHKVIEKLRAHISQCHFHHGETSVPVTISCGVTACTATDTVESIFERADEAMYQAKHSGRNCCIYAG